MTDLFTKSGNAGPAIKTAHAGFGSMQRQRASALDQAPFSAATTTIKEKGRRDQRRPSKSFERGKL
jgi:hypothetical protein